MSHKGNKFRYKKTGEIVNFKTPICMVDEKYSYQYDSIAELNKYWEDYTPAEPLIKDEKVRKAVRVWAEANELSEKLRVINEHFDSCKIIGRCDSRNVCLEIEFKTTIAHAQNIAYSIAELCGEEEE